MDIEDVNTLHGLAPEADGRQKKPGKAEHFLFVLFFCNAIIGFDTSSSANVLPEGTSATWSILYSSIHGNFLPRSLSSLSGSG